MNCNIVNVILMLSDDSRKKNIHQCDEVQELALAIQPIPVLFF